MKSFSHFVSDARDPHDSLSRYHAHVPLTFLFLFPRSLLSLFLSHLEGFNWLNPFIISSERSDYLDLWMFSTFQTPPILESVSCL